MILRQTLYSLPEPAQSLFVKRVSVTPLANNDFAMSRNPNVNDLCLKLKGVETTL